jgi:tetratricopeptide (TPR) repeat protein
LYFNLGNSYSLKGEFQKAGDALAQALKINPDHAGAKAKLQEVEEKLSRLGVEHHLTLKKHPLDERRKK